MNTYLAINGSTIDIPERRELPEYETDLSGLTDAIRLTLPEVARTRLLTFRLDAEGLRDKIENPNPYERKRSAEEKRAILLQLDKIDHAIAVAETKFTGDAGAMIDRLVACFETPTSIQGFHIAMSKLMGCGFLTLANSRGKIVDKVAPWLKPLVGRLSPAHLTALTRSFREEVLFGLNRDMRLFHEDALLPYLQSDIGDVRHLEHDITRELARPPHHAPLQDAIRQGESLPVARRPLDEAPDLSVFWFDYDWHHLRGFPHLIHDYLGLDLNPTDISETYSRLGLRVSGMLKSEQTSYRGYLLEHFIQSPKYSNLTKASNKALWPYVAENFQVLDRVLFNNLKPGSSTPKSAYGALQAIALLPEVPERYGKVLEQLIQFGKKWEKTLALKLLNQK